MIDKIEIKGARVHNLKNIDVKLKIKKEGRYLWQRRIM